MLVNRDKLKQYDIPPSYYFATRSGLTSSARDFYFSEHPELLLAGIHCAVGNDTAGWELELFNGANWVIVNPNPNYLLTITNAGLEAMNSVAAGGLKLTISGVKFISEVVVPNPVTPLINWTDSDFLVAGSGKFVFTCGTNGSVHDDLASILTWRFNSSSGALQYILTLPPNGTGASDDFGNDSYKIGTIGLYIKSPNDNTTDVLFAIARLTSPVSKIGSTVSGMGNSIKFYLNTTLSNLGYVSDLSVIESDEHSIPEVPNEAFLETPTDTTSLPYNCYLVDNLHGTGMPAIAVPRVNKDNSEVTSPTWAYFQPSTNFIETSEKAFASDVPNYSFVYYNNNTSRYEKAEGKRLNDDSANAANDKMPCGIRVGNSIVFNGTVFNDMSGYSYELTLNNPGMKYERGDELIVPAPAGNLVFRVKVIDIVGDGAIKAGEATVESGISFLGPTAGDISVLKDNNGSGEVLNCESEYSPYSRLPHNGSGATFNLRQIKLEKTQWNFDGHLNKPVYCGEGPDAGLPVTYETDALLGWAVSNNGIALNLDLRNEASTTKYGTTQYATNDEVKDVFDHAAIASQRTVTADVLKNNYLQISLPKNLQQAGADLARPIEVETYVHFQKPVLGRCATSPYNSTNTNPKITDENIDFYGLAYSAWYQDIAEYYEADAFYDAGTLVCIGQGPKEMTIATTEANGIISDKPGFILGKLDSDTKLPVALVGRTPVLFDGKCLVNYGDKIYLSKVVPGMASTIKNGPCLGKVIERDFGLKRRIECIVRLAFD